MANNPIPVMLLLVAVGFLIGAAVGYFAFKYEAQKDIPKPGQEQQPDPRKKFLLEVVSLWRERAGSRLVVWFEGKPLNSPQSLDAARRQQLVSAGQEFITWLGGKTEVVESADKPPVVESQENSSSAARPQPAMPAAPADEPAVPAEAANAAVPSRPQTIVEQIDDILQEIIKKDTSLSARAIRLLEDPREGVVVWVGIEHFNGVDTVPYPEVKAVLRQAAAEWERRTEKLRR